MRKSRCPRTGSVLVEFAIIALVLYLLLAAIIEFGRMGYGAQTVQQAADTGARELARIPLPPQTTFAEALADPQVRSRVYDPRYLVVSRADVDAAPTNGSLTTYMADKPVLNRLLSGLFIFDLERDVWRYPGALAMQTNGDMTVLVPLIVSRSAEGHEVIEWHDVVEELRPDPTQEGPFSLLAPTPPNPPGLTGMVALQIHYPFQAATMSSYQPGADPELGRPNVPNRADDGAVTAINSPPGGATLVGEAAADGTPATYSGAFGLGEQQALTIRVRPYRRVITVQAVYRREVFD